MDEHEDDFEDGFWELWIKFLIGARVVLSALGWKVQPDTGGVF